MHLYISPSKAPERSCAAYSPKTSGDLDMTSQGRGISAAEVGVCIVVVCVSLCIASAVVVVGVTQLEQLQRLSATTAHLRESLLPPPSAITDSEEGDEEHRAGRERRSRGSRSCHFSSRRKCAAHFILGNNWRREGCLSGECQESCSVSDNGHNCWVPMGAKWDGVERFESPSGRELSSDDTCRLRVTEEGTYLVYAQVAFTTTSSSPITVDVMHRRSGNAKILTRSRFEATNHESRRDNQVEEVLPRRSLYLSRLHYLQDGDQLVLNFTAAGCVQVSTEAANTFIGLVKVGH